MERCDEGCGYTSDDYRRCFENAVKYDPSNGESHQELGYVLDVYFSDYDGAADAFKKAIDLGAGYESYFGYARVLAEKGMTEDALASLHEAFCPFHDHPEIETLRLEIIDGQWTP